MQKNAKNLVYCLSCLQLLSSFCNSFPAQTLVWHSQQAAHSRVLWSSRALACACQSQQTLFFSAAWQGGSHADGTATARASRHGLWRSLFSRRPGGLWAAMLHERNRPARPRSASGSL
jgi:hypothetical protein